MARHENPRLSLSKPLSIIPRIIGFPHIQIVAPKKTLSMRSIAAQAPHWEIGLESRA
jgi:hypothetical protein